MNQGILLQFAITLSKLSNWVYDGWMENGNIAQTAGQTFVNN